MGGRKRSNEDEKTEISNDAKRVKSDRRVDEDDDDGDEDVVVIESDDESEESSNSDDDEVESSRSDRRSLVVGIDIGTRNMAISTICLRTWMVEWYRNDLCIDVKEDGKTIGEMKLVESDLVHHIHKFVDEFSETIFKRAIAIEIEIQIKRQMVLIQRLLHAVLMERLGPHGVLIVNVSKLTINNYLGITVKGMTGTARHAESKERAMDLFELTYGKGLFERLKHFFGKADDVVDAFFHADYLRTHLKELREANRPKFQFKSKFTKSNANRIRTRRAGIRMPSLSKIVDDAERTEILTEVMRRARERVNVPSSSTTSPPSQKRKKTKTKTKTKTNTKTKRCRKRFPSKK